MRTKLTPEVLELIRVDREERGLTLSAIMERHGLARGTAFKAIAGLDDSKVTRASPSRRVVTTIDRPPRPNLSKANLGEAARQLIAARLMLAGLSVFRPYNEDSPIDLLVLRPDGVALKCQCKCMYVVARSGAHAMSLCTVRKWGPNATAVRHHYRADEVDFFLGYAPETDAVFVFPFDVTKRFSGKLTTWLLRQPTNHNGVPPFDATPFRNAFHLLAP
jgi:hypothetical protein